jgi:AcrR family transcriptional regulator
MISLLEHIEDSTTRRARILVGAMKVFLAYGFQRTTMDDIARAAEISRPALYLLFRNKTDIYRALASGFLEQVRGQTRGA